MVAMMVVVADEGLDLRLQIAREIVLEQDAVLERRLVPAISPRVWEWSGAADAGLFLVIDPGSKIAGDVARAVIRQQARLVQDTSRSQPEASSADPS
jgi:hypothetical protein